MIRSFAHAQSLCVATRYKMYTENNNMGGGGGGEDDKGKNKLMMLPSGLAALIDYTETITL